MSLRYPGEVYLLPPESREDGDTKWRRHLLLTEHTVDSGAGSLAFCSTQSTEAEYGASYHLVDPAKGTYRGTGFVSPTYIYASRIACSPVSELRDAKGRLIDAMVDVKKALRSALGIGSGTALQGVAAGSYRGQLVVLTRALAKELETPIGLIVTEPRYGNQRRYQLIIPVYSADEIEPAEWDVVASCSTSMAQYFTSKSGCFFAAAFVSAIYQPTEIQTVLGEVVGADLMAEIDGALVGVLDLPSS